MGLSIGFSSCWNSDCRPIVDTSPVPKFEVKLPNPDPKKFTINRTHATVSINMCLVLAVNYPDCTNYEGNKILLFVGNIPNLSKITKLDPHFCEGDHPSPFARFEPTNEGWKQAVNLAEIMKDVWLS